MKGESDRQSVVRTCVIVTFAYKARIVCSWYWSHSKSTELAETTSLLIHFGQTKRSQHLVRAGWSLEKRQVRSGRSKACEECDDDGPDERPKEREKRSECCTCLPILDLNVSQDTLAKTRQTTFLAIELTLNQRRENERQLWESWWERKRCAGKRGRVTTNKRARAHTLAPNIRFVVTGDVSRYDWTCFVYILTITSASVRFHSFDVSARTDQLPHSPHRFNRLFTQCSTYFCLFESIEKRVKNRAAALSDWSNLNLTFVVLPKTNRKAFDFVWIKQFRNDRTCR